MNSSHLFCPIFITLIIIIGTLTYRDKQIWMIATTIRFQNLFRVFTFNMKILILRHNENIFIYHRKTRELMCDLLILRGRFTTEPVIWLICSFLMIWETLAWLTSKPLFFNDLNIPVGWRSCLWRSLIWVLV